MLVTSEKKPLPAFQHICFLNSCLYMQCNKPLFLYELQQRFVWLKVDLRELVDSVCLKFAMWNQQSPSKYTSKRLREEFQTSSFWCDSSSSSIVPYYIRRVLVLPILYIIKSLSLLSCQFSP